LTGCKMQHKLERRRRQGLKGKEQQGLVCFESGGGRQEATLPGQKNRALNAELDLVSVLRLVIRRAVGPIERDLSSSVDEGRVMSGGEEANTHKGGGGGEEANTHNGGGGGEEANTHNGGGDCRVAGTRRCKSGGRVAGRNAREQVRVWPLGRIGRVEEEVVEFLTQRPSSPTVGANSALGAPCGGFLGAGTACCHT
jgi:hypothetical protein